MLCVLTAIVTVSAHCPGSCRPIIDNATVIEAVPGLRATVEILPDYGDCSVLNKGYQWTVFWGDKLKLEGNVTDDLIPAQGIHTYKYAGTYLISVRYCSIPEEQKPEGTYCSVCSKRWVRIVTVV